MSTLSELKLTKKDTSNAFFKIILKETGHEVAHVSMTIKETDEALDEFIKMNSGKFKYVQISKKEYDEYN